MFSEEDTHVPTFNVMTALQGDGVTSVRYGRKDDPLWALFSLT